MAEQPDIATIASLVGEPSRASILIALMGGRAMTASELSLEADVSPATASAHLAKLTSAGLLTLHKQGRYRYFQLADELVAEMIETLCGVAERHARSGRRTGPRDPAMRRARVCYDHLAGEVGVQVYESLVKRRCLVVGSDGLDLTDAGRGVFESLGVDVEGPTRARRPLCRQCLDWSERRFHLAGGLGAALLSHLLGRRWARRDPGTRAIHFSPTGLGKLTAAFDL